MIQTKHHFLFCPGPVNIADNIKQAVRHEIGHREQEFSALIRSLNRKILQVFAVKDHSTYHPVFITGSGTAANEAILSSFEDKAVLILANGEFGERLYDISMLHNKNTHILKFTWGREIDVQKVEEFLKKTPTDVIVMVHHETSTGMLNPAGKIGRLAKKNGIQFVLDTVSSAGAERIDLEKWNVAFCSSASGKALGSFPGVGIIIGRKNAFEKLKTVTPRIAYLNLYKMYTYSKTHAQTPNTPAVQLFFALEQALTNILAEGVAKRHEHIKEMTQILRTGMRKLGLGFSKSEKDMSTVLTSVKIPSYITFEILRTELRKKNIIIYNGKGPLLNKIFQVGNIGKIHIEEVMFFLSALKDVLALYKPTKKTARVSKLPDMSYKTNFQPLYIPHQLKHSR